MIDNDLEKAIDEAGREAVFARARALGWGSGNAPTWVWRQIAADVKAGAPLVLASPPPAMRLDEAVLGFRLF